MKDRNKVATKNISRFTKRFLFFTLVIAISGGLIKTIFIPYEGKKISEGAGNYLEEKYQREFNVDKSFYIKSGATDGLFQERAYKYDAYDQNNIIFNVWTNRRFFYEKAEYEDDYVERLGGNYFQTKFEEFLEDDESIDVIGFSKAYIDRDNSNSDSSIIQLIESDQMSKNQHFIDGIHLGQIFFVDLDQQKEDEAIKKIYQKLKDYTSEYEVETIQLMIVDDHSINDVDIQKISSRTSRFNQVRFQLREKSETTEYYGYFSRLKETHKALSSFDSFYSTIKKIR